MPSSRRPLASNLWTALVGPLLRRLAKPAAPRYDGELILLGLAKEVKVYWQDPGIPHVFASNEKDLFFAQGYLHAQERLWQMDLNRRFLSGRLAEILGQFPVPWQELTSHFRGRDSLDADYFMRLMGLRRSALASLDLLTEGDRERLEAYCSGVNRFIERCGKHLPLEFRLLGYVPDLWRPEDTLTIGKGFAFFLSLALFTRLNAIAVSARLVGETQKMSDLYPTQRAGDVTTTRAVWDAAQSLWRFTAGMLAGGVHPAGQGSNAWVLGPTRTASAGAVLCNDPHLRLMLPSNWYLMHLKVDEASPNRGHEVWGASLPGCPEIQIGHNRSIAWGVTAALCDDVEIYREKIDPSEPDRYEMDGRWYLMDRESEMIRIKGRGLVEKTVRWTRHGPVISDFNRAGPAAAVLSLRWTALDPGEEIRCVHGINRALNWDEFLNALSHQSAPALNYVYADLSGNIGYSLAGKIPLRDGARSVLPLEGWRSENEWRDFVPLNELPRSFNPPEGAIANANNEIVDGNYPHYLSAFFEPAYRAQRIHEMLASRKTHRVEDMACAQGDILSLHAKEVIRIVGADLRAVSAGDRQDLAAAANRLLQWDYRCATTSVAAAIFHVFHQRLMENILIPWLGEDLFVTYVEIFNQSIMPLVGLLQNPNSSWFDLRPREELVRTSLAQACAELAEVCGPDPNQWQWGELHTLTLNHAFARLRWLRPFFSLGPFASPGDNFTVNLGLYRLSNPYRHIVGASLRMIVETGPQLRSRFMLSSGQSGHPFGRHFGDQTRSWRQQQYIPLGGSEESTDGYPVLSLRPPES